MMKSWVKKKLCATKVEENEMKIIKWSGVVDVVRENFSPQNHERVLDNIIYDGSSPLVSLRLVEDVRFTYVFALLNSRFLSLHHLITNVSKETNYYHTHTNSNTLKH